MHNPRKQFSTIQRDSQKEAFFDKLNYVEKSLTFGRVGFFFQKETSWIEKTFYKRECTYFIPDTEDPDR